MHTNRLYFTTLLVIPYKLLDLVFLFTDPSGYRGLIVCLDSPSPQVDDHVGTRTDENMVIRTTEQGRGRRKYSVIPLDEDRWKTRGLRKVSTMTYKEDKEQRVP